MNLKHIIFSTMFALSFVFTNTSNAAGLKIPSEGKLERLEHIGHFDDWDAYVYTNNAKKEKVCYVATTPWKSLGEYVRRGDVYLMVSDRPDDDIFDTITFVAGTLLMPRTDVLVRVGGVKTEFFASEDTAWAKSLEDDFDVAKAMAKAGRFTIRSTSIQGVELQDVFSLKGYNEAREAINQLCRQPRD
ncbi:MAG: hypothetical protein MJ247_04050 [Alphaproteobacteria bacterium]|nr:hypothetical protein [Alphaproteobacteria bacterium]